MSTSERPGKPAKEGAARKPYKSPELRVFGDIRAITQANGMGNQSSDIVGGKGTKTG